MSGTLQRVNMNHGTAKAVSNEPGLIGSEQSKLAPRGGKSGPHAWLLDLVVPFGGPEAAVAELKEKGFVGIDVNSVRI